MHKRLAYLKCNFIIFVTGIIPLIMKFSIKLFFIIIIILISCKSDDSDTMIDDYSDILDLPITPYNYSNPNFPDTFTSYVFSFDNTPTDNPVTDHGATLGRVLFYDVRLSINNTISCASCHFVISFSRAWGNLEENKKETKKRLNENSKPN